MASRLGPPRPVRDHVERARLVAKLAGATEVPLTLVVGAPGTGKTSLVARWASGTRASVAWLTLGAHDDGAERFRRHLRVALGEPAVNRPRPLVDIVAERALRRTLVVVLDDLHHAGPSALQEVARLVDELPVGAHVVVTDRADPPLGLARRRADGELLEIRDAELRFDDHEVATFLATAGMPLAPADRAALSTKVEGWPAALRLSVAAMRQHPDPAAFVASLSGTTPAIADYLVGDVLAGCSPEERELLLATSVLEGFTAEDCDRLLDRGGSDEVLEALAARHVLLERAVDGSWRYHGLFRDLLRAELRRNRPDLARQVHTAAAELARGAGLLVDAVDHLVAAGESHRALRLAAADAQSLYDHGEVRPLRLWADRLGREPSLNADEIVEVARLALLGGAVEEAGLLLRRAGRSVGAEDAPPQGIHAGWAWWCLRVGDCVESLQHAAAHRRRVHRRIAPDGLTFLSVLAASWCDHLPTATERARGWPVHPAAPAWIRHVGRPAALGTLAWWHGDVVKASALTEGALASARDLDRCHVAVLAARFVHAACEAERGTAETATDALAELVEDAVASRWRPVMVLGRIEQARLEQAGGRPEAALRQLRLARDLGASHRLGPRLMARVDAAEVPLRLALGELDEARTLAARLPASGWQDLAMVRCLLAEGDGSRALVLLGQLVARTPRERLVAALLAIRALRLVGDPTAVDLGRQVLDRGTTAGFALLLAEEGTDAVEVLGRAATDTRDEAIVDHAVRRLGHPGATELSQRELAILEFLPTRLTAQEIAGELFVSLNTVKSHLKNLYRKLGVSSRDEAVNQAVARGLIPASARRSRLRSRCG